MECKSELPFPPPGDLPNTVNETLLPASPACAGRFLTTEPPGKSLKVYMSVVFILHLVYVFKFVQPFIL